MTDSPKPTPGWYPDPEMVDTVRYWNGSSWTEHRAPAGNDPAAPAVPGVQEVLVEPQPAQPTGTLLKEKKRLSTAWKIVLSLSAVLFIVGAGLVIKSSMDSNIQAGRELADAMTTDRDEQEAVAEFFGNETVTTDSDSEQNGRSAQPNCGAPSVDLVDGIWVGDLTAPEVAHGPKVTQFREDCSLAIANGMSGITWESYGDSVSLMNGDFLNCWGEVNAAEDEISFSCIRVFRGEETIYEPSLTRTV